MTHGWIAALGILLVLLFLVLDRFTVLNITAPEFLHPAALNDAPVLKDLNGSAGLAIAPVGKSYLSHVTYDPKGDYFIVGGRDVTKFDNTGRKTFSYKMEDGAQLARFSHFIVTREAVYDLSRPAPAPEPVAEVINGGADTSLSNKAWKRMYAEAYAKADTVVTVRDFPGSHKQPSFMRIGGQWLLFYTSPSNARIDENWDLGVTIEGFPAKMDRTILLRDPVTRQYAGDSHSLRDGEAALPEDALTYRPVGRLKTLRFVKTYVTEEFPYTPIPQILAGPAWHRLSIGGETMTFRETATRMVFGAFDSSLAWFILPEPYSAKTKISFLEFRPGNNIDTEGSDGLYIVRPR